ncbi:MAG: Uncharacterized protein G01um101472_371 [Parcubacteria group bacterium Gr01-1014_72]|nr:MAG: Uncharacterized protein G01um101472_371 [Parcubacteria group bacterium Gr01-1014_72]
MAINVEVMKTGNENNAALLRRFSKRVQGSGVLPKVRSNRYKTRNESKQTRKKHALKRLTRLHEVERLIKLGKLQDKTMKGRQ